MAGEGQANAFVLGNHDLTSLPWHWQGVIAAEGIK